MSKRLRMATKTGANKVLFGNARKEAEEVRELERMLADALNGKPVDMARAMELAAKQH